ncbi:putative quinol monooxygenase [Arthrobacter sp. NPDC080031]|uniref:putative quinol monooxygenase n=1 Tax=unclassified Arthrobacter TaxID=235627 RepID=UPI00342F7A2C
MNPSPPADRNPAGPEAQEAWLMPVFTPKSGRGAELRTTLQELQHTSRKDQGCIEYSVFEVDGRFVLIEGWDSRADLDSHNEQAHVKEFVRGSVDLLAEPFTVTPITPLG